MPLLPSPCTQSPSWWLQWYRSAVGSPLVLWYPLLVGTARRGRQVWNLGNRTEENDNKSTMPSEPDENSAIWSCGCTLGSYDLSRPQTAAPPPPTSVSIPQTLTWLPSTAGSWCCCVPLGWAYRRKRCRDAPYDPLRSGERAPFLYLIRQPPPGPACMGLGEREDEQKRKETWGMWRPLEQTWSRRMPCELRWRRWLRWALSGSSWWNMYRSWRTLGTVGVVCQCLVLANPIPPSPCLDRSGCELPWEQTPRKDTWETWNSHFSALSKSWIFNSLYKTCWTCSTCTWGDLEMIRISSRYTKDEPIQPVV